MLITIPFITVTLTARRKKISRITSLIIWPLKASSVFMPIVKDFNGHFLTKQNFFAYASNYIYEDIVTCSCLIA